MRRGAGWSARRAIDFDIVDRRRAAVEPDIGRERRLHARHALLALEGFEHRRLFAADIGPGAVMDVEIERPAVDVVLADEPRLIGLVDRGLEMLALLYVFAAHVDVAASAPMANEAISAPSTSVCGSLRMISRSLQVPGSDSSALMVR